MVGAGVGGLYTAARLAKAGVQTTLVEQNPREDAGGRLETIWLDAAGRRFRFEVGPSLLLLPGVYREALETLGLDADAHLNLARVAPAYAVHYRDGGPTPLEVGGDAQAEARLRAAMDGVEPGAHSSFRAYMDAAQANLHAGLPIFIREQLTPDSLSRLPRFLSAALLGGGGPAARRSAPLVDWPLRTHAAQLEDRFDAPRHRALLGFQVRGRTEALRLAPRPASTTLPHPSPAASPPNWPHVLLLPGSLRGAAACGGASCLLAAPGHRAGGPGRRRCTAWRLLPYGRLRHLPRRASCGV